MMYMNIYTYIGPSMIEIYKSLEKGNHELTDIEHLDTPLYVYMHIYIYIYICVYIYIYI
jgi:hypothetical protein